MLGVSESCWLLAWREARQVPSGKLGEGWPWGRRDPLLLLPWDTPPPLPRAWATEPWGSMRTAYRGRWASRAPASSFLCHGRRGEESGRSDASAAWRKRTPDIPAGAWLRHALLRDKALGGQAAGTPGLWAAVGPSRKPQGPSCSLQPWVSVLLKKQGRRPCFPFFSDSRSWNLHPLGFAIFTHPEPSGLHGDASKQQIPGGNDVTCPFPAAQASSRCHGAAPATPHLPPG